MKIDLFNKNIFPLMATAALLDSPVIDEKAKPVSKGIQLTKKVYKHRQKRMKMQKQSRKLNRA
jgi:hypothetical protein